MYDTNISMISMQPFCIAKTDLYKKVQYNNGRFISYTASFRIPQDSDIRMVPDCFSTVLFSASGRCDPVLITPITRPGQNFHLPQDEYYSVKLSPYASYAVYHLIARIPDFSNRILPAAEVFLDIGSVLEQILNPSGQSNLLSILPAYFMHQFRFAPFAQHIDKLISRIMLSNCTITEKELSEESGLSGRYIYQLFTDKVGCSPKMFSRILRFQNALFKLLSLSRSRTESTPYELNYYDQSHFLKEFQKFCGTLPSEMQKIMAGHPVD